MAVAGSVAVGKTTVAAQLVEAIARRAPELTAAVLSTDGFLLPNATLDAAGLTLRKGFPESYDHAALQAIGKTAFGYRDRFNLSSPPDLTAAPPFEVKLDGVVLPEMNGTGTVWAYDVTSNSMRFEPLYVPEPGQTHTITYRVACP